MGGLGRVIGGLRRAAHGDAPDAELVRRFAATRDEAAFEQLVCRHGPLVLGVCRRTFPPAADDAFQATFLLLALRAGRLRDPAGVAGWLHGVAVRTSREAKAMAARRRFKERLAARPEAAPHPPDAEALARLDAAVAALPARYRAAVLLCDLAEKTRAEAAAELGVPEGTVASRLARGRRLLAAKLGGTLPAVVAVAVPPALTANAVQAGVLLAAGGAVPPAVSLLVTGVTRAMSGSVLKPVVAAGLVAVGVGGAWGWTTGDGPKPADQPPAVAAKPKAETPAEEFARIKTEYEAQLKKNTGEIPDPLGGPPIPQTIHVDGSKAWPRLLELGRTADESTALAALGLAAFSMWTNLDKPDDKLPVPLDIALTRFADRPGLKVFVRELIKNLPVEGGPLLTRVLTEASDRECRGLALLMLADEVNPQLRPLHRGPGAPAKKVRAERLYRRAGQEYADVKHPDWTQTVGEFATERLKAFEKARAGRPAPPLTGTGSDDKPFDLKAARGQVVLVHFYQTWDDFTDAEVFPLRRLHPAYAGKGVRFVGVPWAGRADDGTDIRNGITKAALPWPQLTDYRTHRDKAFFDWQVSGFPTVYVIGRDGTVRNDLPFPAEDELRQLLDAALAEK